MKKITLMLNNRCNWNCKHCYLPGGKDKSPEMALQQAKQLIQDGYEVNPAGAEVLLEPRYLEIYQLAGQKYLLTNGLAIARDPSLLTLIKFYGIEEIRLSRHYLIHEDLNGAPLFEIDSAIRLVIKSGIKLIIQSVTDCRNYKGIIDACRDAKSIGAQGIRFIRLMNSGHATNFDNHLFLTKDQVRTVLEQIQSVKAIYSKNDLVIMRSATFGPKTGCFCPAADEFFAISTDDQIYPCTFMMDPKYVIGSLQKGKMVINKSIFNNPDRTLCLAYQNGE